MSCCSGRYCQFQFPEGPSLTDYPVTQLSANYLFLPYGTLLEEEEVIRIWTESGKTETVILGQKIPLTILPGGPVAKQGEPFLPWQLIALDSGMELETIENWISHPLHNPDAEAVVLKFRHPIVIKTSLKVWWLKCLYKIRNL